MEYLLIGLLLLIPFAPKRKGRKRFFLRSKTLCRLGEICSAFYPYQMKKLLFIFIREQNKQTTAFLFSLFHKFHPRKPEWLREINRVKRHVCQFSLLWCVREMIEKVNTVQHTKKMSLNYLRLETKLWGDVKRAFVRKS